MESQKRTEQTYQAVGGIVMTETEVAQILTDAFGGSCACNINGNDEWLPFVCKYCEGETPECPEPKETNGCWLEYLRHLNRRDELLQIPVEERGM